MKIRNYTMAALAMCGLFLSAEAADGIKLRNLDNRDAATRQGTSLGVPFAKGSVKVGSTFSITDANGAVVPSQARTLAYWEDGSIKWVGLSLVDAGQHGDLSLNVTAPARKKLAPAPAEAGLAVKTADGIKVNTGAVECLFPTSGNAVVRDIKVAGKVIASAAVPVLQLEKRKGSAEMQTVSIEKFEGKIGSVEIIDNGPLSCQIKVEGVHKGASSGREWIPFSLYFKMYKGMESIEMTHSFRFDSDGREDYIKGLGLRFDVPFRDEVHNRHVRLAGSGKDGSGFWCQPVRLAPGYRPSAGRVFVNDYEAYLEGAKLPAESELKANELAALNTCPIWADMRLVQSGPGTFSMEKRTSPESSWVHYVDGERSIGAAMLGDTEGSILVGVRDFWQNCPSSLQIDHAGDESGSLTAWLWSPDAPAMDMRHYDTIPHDLKINYEDYKEGWESPYGVGHRSDLVLRAYDRIPATNELWEAAKAVQKPVQYTCEPEYYYGVKAFGSYWGLPRKGDAVCEKIEAELDMQFEFYRRQVEERSWYGFWNYGDVMHNYDFTRHDWRYDIGGWAWNNIELAPNVLLWTAFLRSGREDLWNMAMAMEKHASEVDVHHIGRWAPLGSRHNVTHWGDGCKQPRIEYAAMKRYMYYLTGGDARTGDLMTEQIGSEKAYDYARRVSTWGAVGGTYLKSSLNDWAYYAGNWMLEWERTGSSEWRDHLLNSMKDLVALSRFSGRLTFDYFDPETGRFMVYLNEKPVAPGTGAPAEVNAPKEEFVPAATLSAAKLGKIVGQRLSRVRGDTFSTLFGAPELLTDLRASVDYPEFWKLVDQSFADVADVEGGSMTGPRMASWVYHFRGDDQMANMAWKNLLNRGMTDTESDGTAVREHDPLNESYSSRRVVKPYADPFFSGQNAGWQRHTPSTTQWLINALEVMEWCPASAR